MKQIVLPMLSAVLLLATDYSGVRPRSAPKDYPAYESAGGITIAAAVVPANKVQHQLSPNMVKAGYTVLEIAVYPDAGKDVDVSADDFSMTVGSNTETSRAATPAEVAQAIEPGRRTNPPRIPGNVQVETTQTVGVTNGGYDPATGRRYPGGVYTSTGAGVGIGDPRGPAPPPADPGLDPRYPNHGGGPGGPPVPQGAPQSVRDKLEQKALPEGRTMKAVAGYVYFPEVSPRLKNSTEPYQLIYSGPNGEIRLTVPAK
jgi:hypothetical protein